MSVDFSFHVGYGFLVSEDDYPLPEKWADREVWYDGTVEKELSGSGVEVGLALNQTSGPFRWGLMAEGSQGEMDKFTNAEVLELRDPDPSTVANLWDIMTSLGIKARIGWMMWVDVN